MQVLLADPTDPFFVETAKLQFNRDEVEKRLTEMKSKWGETQVRLRTIAITADREKGLEFRTFTNQMRLPMIIIDNSFCVLTVRVPPYEASEAMRIEMIKSDKLAQDYIMRCANHFSKVWEISTPIK